MAVLKHTSPTAWPVAPSPCPSSTVPSASTSTAVGAGSAQADSSCLSFMGGLHSRGAPERQSGKDGTWIAEHGLAVRIRVAGRDGHAGLLRAGGSWPSVYPGVCGRLRAGVGLRVPAGRLAVRVGRRRVGGDRGAPLAEKN